MASVGLKAKVRSLERRLGTRRATDPHEGHTWTSQEAVAYWAHGDRAGGLEFARAYVRAYLYNGEPTLAAALRELVVVLTPDRPFSFDLLPRGLQALLRDRARARVERIIQAPATPIDPYGDCPLAHHIQDGPPRFALTRERLEAAKLHWEEKVRASDAMCRELGIEPRDWSGVVDWGWYDANCAPEPAPAPRWLTSQEAEAEANRKAWAEYQANLDRLHGRPPRPAGAL